jgi:hypothetical protein
MLVIGFTDIFERHYLVRGGGPMPDAEPTERQKKRYSELRIKVVRSLLESPELSLGELADFAGYKTQGLTKGEYVRRPLNSLVESGVVDSIPKKGTVGNRRGPVFRLSRDLKILDILYQHKDFAKYQNEFQQSGWLKELIVQTRFENFADPFKDDLVEMLGCSPAFFTFCLSDSCTIEKMYTFSTTFDSCPVVPRDYFGNIFEEERFKSGLWVPNFLLLFAFVDHLDKKKPNIDHARLTRCINRMRTRLSEDRRRLQDFKSTVDYMKAVLAFEDLIQKNKGEVPESLRQNLTWYYNDLDFYRRSKQKNKDLERKVDFHYNHIAEILKFDIRRTPTELD